MDSMFDLGSIMAFHPGFYLAEVIAGMGMSLYDFSMKTDIDEGVCQLLIAGKTDMTDEMASKIASALGTSVELWQNLQSNYDKMISKVKTAKGL